MCKKLSKCYFQVKNLQKKNGFSDEIWSVYRTAITFITKSAAVIHAAGVQRIEETRQSAQYELIMQMNARCIISSV